MPSTMQNPLAAMLPHEALAVFYRLHSDLCRDAIHVAEQLEQLEEHVVTVVDVLGMNHVSDAAHAFFFDEAPENVEYLAELVARVRA